MITMQQIPTKLHYWFSRRDKLGAPLRLHRVEEGHFQRKMQFEFSRRDNLSLESDTMLQFSPGHPWHACFRFVGDGANFMVVNNL